MNFDMNRTWSHAVALVQANFQLLAVIAGVFILVPNLIFYLALPDVMMAITSSLNPDPEQMTAMLADQIGPMIGFGALVVVAQFIGYASLVALMGNTRPTVGEALRQGLGAIPTLLGITLLTILIYLVLGLALALVVGVFAALLAMAAGEAAIVLVTLVSIVLLFAGMIYITARFLMVYPAIMLEGITNPITAMQRSWQLTKPHAKRIFWFLMLLFVAYLVISLIVSSIFGLLIAAMGTGTAAALASGLLNGVLGCLVATIFAGIMVAMHKQLAGTDTADIGETFE